MTEIEPLRTDDYEQVAAWLSEPNINKWLASPWRGKRTVPRVLTVLCLSPRNKLYLVRNDGAPCGLVGLEQIDPIDRTAMLWYLLGDRGLAGRGIMTTALGQVVRLAFRQLGLRALNVSIMAPNHASRRILEKNGFRQAGVLRNALDLDGQPVDRILYDIIPSDLDQG